MKVKLNHSLKNYNTFGIECNADRFIELHSEKELQNILITLHEDEKLLILGGGSNILLTDDFHGQVIKLSFTEIKIQYENESCAVLKVGAGVIWDDLVKYAVDQNLAGIENLSLIPGSAGAAPIQNIGAYGQELSQTFHLLEGFYIQGAGKSEFTKDECRFGYRESIFKHQLKNKFIITSVYLKLKKDFFPEYSYAPLHNEIKKLGYEPGLKDIREIIIRIRNSKLPDPKVLGNAGSFFKNPIVDSETYNTLQKKFPDIKGFPSGNQFKLYAGWLIEKCGWKGFRKGDVGSYSEQALVIVNYGRATGKEILEYAARIKESVLTKFGVQLQEEINII